MTVTSKLARAEWKQYFNRVSALLEGERVEIDVASLPWGTQPLAKWLPLLGLMYDEREDLISVMAQGLDHMIRRPDQVFIDTEGVDLRSLEVIDGDGVRHLIRFGKPILLPSAGG